MPTTCATDIEQAIINLADSHHAQVLKRFFRTGEGEYGYGDKFLGVPNPQVRLVVKGVWRTTPLAEATQLVQSSWHEVRLCGLLIMVELFTQAKKQKDEAAMCVIFECYTSLHSHINNWDLVDLSAYKIVGEYEMLHPEEALMDSWILPSHTLWQQRIAMVASWKHVRYNRYDKIIARATILLSSQCHLLQKASGWILREMYKHNDAGKEALEDFLSEHIAHIPSITLSYACERMSNSEKQYWRNLRKNSKLTVF